MEATIDDTRYINLTHYPDPPFSPPSANTLYLLILVSSIDRSIHPSIYHFRMVRLARFFFFFLFLLNHCCNVVCSFVVLVAPSTSSNLLKTTTTAKTHSTDQHSAAVAGTYVSPQRQMSSTTTRMNSMMIPTELPDSLEDAAERAAQATLLYVQQQRGGPIPSRCRVNFDTTVGDETFSVLTTTTEFMQYYVSALCMGMIDGWAEYKRNEVMQIAQAKAMAQRQQQQQSSSQNDDDEEEGMNIPAAVEWKGPTVRIIFPDEGSAALARRDWQQKVPKCCRFSACGGVQRDMNDKNNDAIVLYYCPKASESDAVEQLLELYETNAAAASANGDDDSTTTALKASIFVNPNLVDMGVTGFGYAGRRLRERLIDTLGSVYYLRTLSWGALTRMYPNAYTVWQEDSNAAGGYRNIAILDRLPSNPEVEDIYDIENGIVQKSPGGGLLDQFGDFVNGMMKL